MLWKQLFIFFLSVSCSIVFSFRFNNNVNNIEPQQVHLAYGDTPEEMVITWNTLDDVNISVVQYGIDKLNLATEGFRTVFVDGGRERRKQIIHRVKLTNLIPGQPYVYRCGSPYSWSKIFDFIAMKNGSDWSPRFVLYGDMGAMNAKSLDSLITETSKHTYDAVLHVGDFAYDMEFDNGRLGDEFMKLIEPIAAYVPYMTCVGNHENAYNFSHYKNRFSMPGSENNLLYSFNIGPAHIISFSTEFYFFIYYGFWELIKQYHWLEADLKEANKPENRAKHPWIITMGHRPMYCSNNDKDDCTSNESIIRKGIPIIHVFGLEKLFYKYGVDLELWAHEHSYERLWPIFDRKVFNGSTDEPYTNPKAPVHIITGSAGCAEEHDLFKNQTQYWSAFRSIDYGYTRMIIHNKTHLYLEQVSIIKNGEVIDKMWLKKDKHGPDAWL